MSIKLKTAEDLYQSAPNLELIEKRLESSEATAEKRNADNKAKSAQAKKNIDRIPGLRPVNYQPVYPDHYHITRIWSNKKWEVLPTSPKSGRENYRNDISSLASTRNAEAFEIYLFQGRKSVKSKPERYIIYLSQETETEAQQLGTLPTTEPNKQSNSEIEKLRTQFVELQKSTGNTNDKAILEANFNNQLAAFQHKNEIDNIHRDYKIKLDEKDREIQDLEEEIEDLQAEREEQEETLNGVADQLTKKAEPQPFMVALAGAIANAGEKLAIKHHEVLGKWTGMNAKELKEMLEKAANNDEQQKIESGSEASFSEVKEDDEYKGYKPEHKDAIKQLHIFVKSLNEQDFKNFYTICSFCCTSAGDLHPEHVKILLEALYPVMVAEESN